MLGGCSGGGEGGTVPFRQEQPSANQPPSFTSPATVSAPENSDGTIYTATASDPEGDSLTFSIAGGVDGALLRMTGGGALSFRDPPDFETPRDSNRNNIYRVRLGVSDGMGSNTLDLLVTVTNRGPDKFRVRRVGTGFDRPLFVAPVPGGGGRIFVVEQPGRILIYNPNTGVRTTPAFLSVIRETTTEGERGLLGFATAPDFATSGFFYVNLTNNNGDTEIRRYRTMAGNPNRADPASVDLILGYAQFRENHNGGWLGFGPDGYLYIASGDGGANFGWSIVEGTQPFKGDPRPSFVPPVAEFGHGTGPRQGNAVTGGYVYRGPVEALQGHYFFGDFVTGHIWSLRQSLLRTGRTLPSSAFVVRTKQFVPDQGEINRVSSFGVDEAGNLYIVDFDGEIFRVEPL
jgi:hypothetical protein